MKKIVLLIVLPLMFRVLLAQNSISILFVNDNAAFAPNTQTMLLALQQTGFAFSTFDAVAQQRSPVYDELNDYDLVLWYTSTDGVALYFWNGNDENNPHLIQYLNNGGKLVVMGNDFLYDRYFTPTNFVQGDFVYDYLGTSVYQGQSYGDDGGQGLPQLDLMEGHNLTTLNPVQWIFPTLWWADACLPAPGAIPVYRMGPGSYVLSSFFSAIYFQQPNYSTLSMFFDPALIDTDANRIQLLTQVISHFQNLVGIEKNWDVNQVFDFWPNPVRDQLRIKLNQTENQHFTLYDLHGRKLKTWFVTGGKTDVVLNVSDLPDGVYYLSTSQSASSRKIVITRN